MKKTVFYKRGVVICFALSLAAIAVFVATEMELSQFAKPAGKTDKPAFTQLKAYDADDLSQFQVDEIVDDFLYVAFPKNSNTLVKQTEPVIVTFDYLIYMGISVRSGHKPKSVLVPHFESFKAGSPVEKQVSDIAAVLSFLTGITVKGYRHEPSKLKDTYPRINQKIDPTPVTLWLRASDDLMFKYELARTDSYMLNDPDSRRGTFFTSGVPSQVEGKIINFVIRKFGSPPTKYYAPGPLAEVPTPERVQKASCAIGKRHSEPMLRALTTECLVRSFGLFNPSRLTQNAVISHWNAAYDRFLAKNPKYPRFKAMFDESSPIREPRYTYLDTDKIFDEPINPNALRFDLSAYDRLLLRILYDDALKPGMTRDEVAAVLPVLVKKHRDAMLNEE